MNECQHKDFEAQVSVNRITDGDNGPIKQLMADISIRCAHCKVQLSFPGFKPGLSFVEAMVSFDGTELRTPLAIGPSLPGPEVTKMTFQLKPPEGKHQ